MKTVEKTIAFIDEYNNGDLGAGREMASDDDLYISLSDGELSIEKNTTSDKEEATFVELASTTKITYGTLKDVFAVLLAAIKADLKELLEKQKGG